MGQAQFAGISACVYDAYGTLFDVHTAVGKHKTRLGAKAEAVSTVWRTKQLEYTWLRSLMETYADFWQVTGDTLEYALETHDVYDSPLQYDLLDAYLHLECYPEVKETLERLKQHGAKNVLLSNGSPIMLEAAVANSGIEGLLDQILSVDLLPIYKPAPQVYQTAVARLKVRRTEISFPSSNAWDGAGAASYGFQMAWINRFGQHQERLPAGAKAERTSLDELPELLGYGPR